MGKFSIRNWRKRTTVEDGSHTPHRLQTTLNAGREKIVTYLRTHLRLSLDDLLEVVREFSEPAMSRLALGRPLRRRGPNRLPEPEIEKTQIKSFKAYEPGHAMGVHRHQEQEDRGGCALVLARTSQGHAVQRIKTPLTDNGRECTGSASGRREKDASGEHEFDAQCQSLGIEHRLTKPKHPLTNGMVERFNGRLARVLKSHRFNSDHDLETTLHRFV